jgi:hypothetical protein
MKSTKALPITFLLVLISLLTVNTRALSPSPPNDFCFEQLQGTANIWISVTPPGSVSEAYFKLMLETMLDQYVSCSENTPVFF